MTRKLSYRRYEKLKTLGADFIEDYELGYPLDPFEIADRLGVTVIVHSKGLPPAAWLCSTTDGYTTPVKSAHGVKFEVHLNGTKSPARQRFTLSHELAHIWLDHPRVHQSASEEESEAEANFLAAYLLAPDSLTLDWVPELSIAGIAREFQVSDEAATNIHRRVMRKVNAEAPDREYDRRIRSVAFRRNGISGPSGATTALRGSA